MTAERLTGGTFLAVTMRPLSRCSAYCVCFLGGGSYVNVTICVLMLLAIPGLIGGAVCPPCATMLLICLLRVANVPVIRHIASLEIFSCLVTICWLGVGFRALLRVSSICVCVTT